MKTFRLPAKLQSRRSVLYITAICMYRTWLRVVFDPHIKCHAIQPPEQLSWFHLVRNSLLVWNWIFMPCPQTAGSGSVASYPFIKILFLQDCFNIVIFIILPVKICYDFLFSLAYFVYCSSSNSLVRNWILILCQHTAGSGSYYNQQQLTHILTSCFFKILFNIITLSWSVFPVKWVTTFLSPMHAFCTPHPIIICVYVITHTMLWAHYELWSSSLYNLHWAPITSSFF
jgi:hypothetical protein